MITRCDLSDRFFVIMIFHNVNFKVMRRRATTEGSGAGSPDPCPFCRRYDLTSLNRIVIVIVADKSHHVTLA